MIKAAIRTVYILARRIMGRAVPERGLTLTELMAAVVISALVMSLLAAVLFNLSNVWPVAGARGLSYNQAAMLLDQVADAIHSAGPGGEITVDKNGYQITGENLTYSIDNVAANGGNSKVIFIKDGVQEDSYPYFSFSMHPDPHYHNLYEYVVSYSREGFVFSLSGKTALPPF